MSRCSRYSHPSDTRDTKAAQETGIQGRRDSECNIDVELAKYGDSDIYFRVGVYVDE